MSPKQAMLLAAGLGKRMGALTQSMPKPLIDVGGRTMLDRALDNLEATGVEKVVVNTFYRAEMIEGHLRQRRFPEIIMSHEDILLETGGGIANALHHFGNKPFYAVNSDVVWFEDEAPALSKLASGWNDGLDGLLLLHPLATATGYEGKGDFFIDADGALRRRGEAATAPYIFTGMQILHPRLFRECPKGAFSLNILYDKLLSANPPRLKSVLHYGTLLNVGDPAGKKLAEETIQKMDRQASTR